jgi:hypothetical protein
MKIIKRLLLNPADAIREGKAVNKNNIEKVSSLLLIEWFIIGLANVIVYANLGKLTMFSLGLTVFFLGISLILFFAFLLKIVMITLGGKGNYYRALTALVYGTFALSIGILISSPFFYVPKFGFLFGLLFLSISGALSIATLYRAVKEFFETDIMTTWIGMGLVATGLTIGIYLTIILLLGGTSDFLPVISVFEGLNF